MIFRLSTQKIEEKDRDRYQQQKSVCWSPPLSEAELAIMCIDQVESEGWVDKIAALGFWLFFTSYICKLREKAIFFTWNRRNKKSAGV